MGVGKEIFIEPQIFDSLPLLICKLCNKVLSLENVELPCGHVFCKLCYDSCVQITRECNCPQCKTNVDYSNLKSSPVATNILSPLQTQCQKCSWRGVYQHYEFHGCSMMSQNSIQGGGGLYSSSGSQTMFANNVMNAQPQTYQTPVYNNNSFQAPQFTPSSNSGNNSYQYSQRVSVDDNFAPQYRSKKAETSYNDYSQFPPQPTYYEIENERQSIVIDDDMKKRSSLRSSSSPVISPNQSRPSSLFNSVHNPNNRELYSTPNVNQMTPHYDFIGSKKLCKNCGGKSATKIGEDGYCNYCRMYG